VKITELHFSGATSKDTLSKIIFRSLRAELRCSTATLRELLEVKMTISSA
jgi:hypothetical protein